MTSEQEQAEKNAKIAAGTGYAALKMPDAKIADRKAFGMAWADIYEPQGLTMQQALETFKS